ncbi:MAG: hypothetical protein FWG57_02280 [Endomicrobia bacterium]|nr:hypothetical protein [Endomicrobiia bacterium]
MRFAYHYLTDQENVIDEHGALAGLVGDGEYESPEYRVNVKEKHAKREAERKALEDINEKYVQKVKDFFTNYNNSKNATGIFSTEPNIAINLANPPIYVIIGRDILDALNSDIQVLTNDILNNKNNRLNDNHKKEIRKMMGSLSELVKEYKDEKSKVIAAQAQPAAETGAQTEISLTAKFIGDILKAIAKLLGIKLKGTYIAKNYPELSGLDDVINLGKYSDEQALFNNLIEKAQKGKNVHAVMPLEDMNIDDTSEKMQSNGWHLKKKKGKEDVEVLQTGLRHIYSISFVNNSGFSINMYYYTADKDDKAKKVNASYDALSHIVRHVLEGSVGVIENDLDSGISYADLLILSPESTVYARTNSTEDDKDAQKKSYSNVTYGKTEEDKIKQLGQERKIKKEGNDMRNQPRTFTIADVSRITDTKVLGKIDKVGSNTAIIRLNYSGFKDNAQAIRKFIAEAHKMDISVILEFKTSTVQEASQMFIDLGNNTGSIKALRDKSGRGIDGMIFDFDSFNKDDISEITKSDAVKGLLSAVKGENADGLLAVKTSHYTDEFKSNGFTDFNNKWIEILKRSGEYNKETLEANELAKSAVKEIENGAEAIGFSIDDIELLENQGINFNFTALILGIVAKWVAALKKTPEGRYREGKRSGLNEKIPVSFVDEAYIENRLYGILRGMRVVKSNNDQHNFLQQFTRDLSALVPTNKSKSFMLEASKELSLDDEKLLFAEVIGYLQGMLERIEYDRHAKGLKFKIKTDADIYRSALVEARMYKLTTDTSIPNARGLLAKEIRNKDTEIDENLAKVGRLIFQNNKGPKPEELREAINTLAWIIESGKVSPENKPIALTYLLDLLAAYNKEAGNVEKIVVTDKRAGTLAILASA